MRLFVKPNSISQYLKCSICMEVFICPTRLFCSHTFCYNCLQDCLQQSNNCPVCRQKIDMKKIGIDLLANFIINDLEVFCSNTDCPWKGCVEQLQTHLQYQCIIKKEKNGKNMTTDSIHLNHVDEEVQETINQHTVKGSLANRVLSKLQIFEKIPDDRIKQTNSTPELTGRRRAQKKITQKKIISRNSHFQFLDQLFE